MNSSPYLGRRIQMNLLSIKIHKHELLFDMSI